MTLIKSLLHDFSFVLVSENKIIVDNKKGVAPLLCRIPSDLSEFTAGDKIVGAAAAYLYVLLGVKTVYTPVISKSAVEVFENYGIKYFFETKIPQALNPAGTAPCPMEQAVAEASSPEDARQKILEKIAEMRK